MTVIKTEIEKSNKLKIPKWLMHQTVGKDVKVVTISESEDKTGIIVEKAE